MASTFSFTHQILGKNKNCVATELLATHIRPSRLLNHRCYSSGRGAGAGGWFRSHQRVLSSSLKSSSSGPDLSFTVNGLHMPNPFVIGSGPPGTNYTVMKRAFDEGWGAVIAKTVSLDAAKVINVTPRYARLRAGGGEANGLAKGQIIGWENFEVLISDRSLETMLKEFKQLG